ncbi:Tn3 family transposase [Streptomyces sp. NPDC048438]|uniref:Tn3 family transposase n=1 Tax=Streptomyces sp. NPDC048438 TaxID=3365551 RepID=UPI003715249D
MHSCNVGCTPAIGAEDALNYGRLSHVDQTYLRLVTYRAANANVDRLPGSHPARAGMGGNLVASANGVRFVVPVLSLDARPNRSISGAGAGDLGRSLTSDMDHNFVREFQADGDSPRAMELALFAALREQGKELDRTSPAPDFVVVGDTPVAIEATTTNPPQGETAEGVDIAAAVRRLILDDLFAVVRSCFVGDGVVGYVPLSYMEGCPEGPMRTRLGALSGRVDRSPGGWLSWA